MKCNWCGKGIGGNYTRDVHGKLFYYFCVDCVTDYRNELGERKNQETIAKVMNKLKCLKTNLAKDRTNKDLIGVSLQIIIDEYEA